MKLAVTILIFFIFSIPLMAQDHGQIPPGTHIPHGPNTQDPTGTRLRLADIMKFRQDHRKFIKLINQKKIGCKVPSPVKNLSTFYMELIYKDAGYPMAKACGVNEKTEVEIKHSPYLDCLFGKKIGEEKSVIITQLQELMESPAYEREMMKTVESGSALSPITTFYNQIVQDYEK